MAQYTKEASVRIGKKNHVRMRDVPAKVDYPKFVPNWILLSRSICLPGMEGHGVLPK